MLKINNHALLFDYLRIDIDIFHELLVNVGPAIEKKTGIREPIRLNHFFALECINRYKVNSDGVCFVSQSGAVIRPYLTTAPSALYL